MLKKSLVIIAAALLICSMAACTTQEGTSSSSASATSSQTDSGSASDSGSDSGSADSDSSSQGESSSEDSESSYTANTNGKLDTSDMFSKRDLSQTADTSHAKTITVEDNKTIDITDDGVYIITGTASNCTIKVEADKDSKIQLVLDGVSITNESMAAIYVVSADKCFITTTDSENTLSVTGTFTSDDDTNVDAVIFSKDDLILNGTGTLTLNSAEGHAVTGKDSIKVTGGTYNITAAKHGFQANDSIAVCGGSFDINCSKDGFHSENADDDSVGWIYIGGGTLNIKATSDGLHGTTYTQIDGGTINITSGEGIECTYIQINGGKTTISSTDDGLNGSYKSKSIGTPTIEITDGELNVTVSGSDVDCIDSNGDIIVSGGTINVNYPAQGPSEGFDYDGTATYTGGTIIINGTQVDSIPQSQMGGGMGGGGMGRPQRRF